MLVEEKNASLSTLSVTIQALHVQGKQMTLAVFRQLPKMAINKDCSIWGIVRYEIKDSGDLWLVFSFNNCLYRMPLDLSSYYIREYEQKITKQIKFIESNQILRLCDNFDEEREKILNNELIQLKKYLHEERERLELHQYYANNYPQLFIAV